jgi:hypothetical protein
VGSPFGVGRVILELLRFTSGPPPASDVLHCTKWREVPKKFLPETIGNSEAELAEYGARRPPFQFAKACPWRVFLGLLRAKPPSAGLRAGVRMVGSNMQ